MKISGGVDIGVVKSGRGGAGIDFRIMAMEVLGSRRLLIVFSELAAGPVCSYTLVRREKTSYIYKVFKRLSSLGLVEYAVGLDRRRRYYVLTEKGLEVLKIVRSFVARAVGAGGDGYVEVAEGVLSGFAARLGVDVSALVKLLGASRHGGVYRWSIEKSVERSAEIEVYG